MMEQAVRQLQDSADGIVAGLRGLNADMEALRDKNKKLEEQMKAQMRKFKRYHKWYRRRFHESAETFVALYRERLTTLRQKLAAEPLQQGKTEKEALLSMISAWDDITVERMLPPSRRSNDTSLLSTSTNSDGSGDSPCRESKDSADIVAMTPQMTSTPASGIPHEKSEVVTPNHSPTFESRKGKRPRKLLRPLGTPADPAPLTASSACTVDAPEIKEEEAEDAADTEGAEPAQHVRRPRRRHRLKRKKDAKEKAKAATRETLKLLTAAASPDTNNTTFSEQARKKPKVRMPKVSLGRDVAPTEASEGKKPASARAKMKMKAGVDAEEDTAEFLKLFEEGPLQKYNKGYKYEVTIRGSERQLLKAYTCAECEKFYKATEIDSQTRQELINTCSRHRRYHSPPRHLQSMTNNGGLDVWEMRFPDAATDPQQSHIKFREQPLERVGDRVRLPTTQSLLQSQ